MQRDALVIVHKTDSIYNKAQGRISQNGNEISLVALEPEGKEIWVLNKNLEEVGSPRQVEEAGKKFDQGKPRWDLLPYAAVEEVVQVLTFGAAKYGPNNWQKVEPFEDRYKAAMMRHLAAVMRGEDFDSESGLLHLAHGVCCALFLLHRKLEDMENTQAIDTPEALGAAAFKTI